MIFVFILIVSGYSCMAQCTCQGSNGNVYYQQGRQQYYEPQQIYLQEPVQYYYSQNNYSNHQYGEPVYFQQPLTYNKEQRFANTLYSVEHVVNIFGQIIGLYQQVRGGGQQYYQAQQQYHSPPQPFY